MPHQQAHRGKHPEDAALFSPAQVPGLRQAVADFSWLLSRGYSEKSTVKLVGDRYTLNVRQRRAVSRGACSDQSLAYRNAHRILLEQIRGASVSIDGYNLLITVESAMGRGILLRGRDGCIRDMASIHGSYRKVEETYPAIQSAGATLERLSVARATWYFDAPVSNSGRLRAMLENEAERHSWPWDVKLANNPDLVLCAVEETVITSDGWILDRAHQWANLAEAIIASIAPEPEVIDLLSERG